MKKLDVQSEKEDLGRRFQFYLRSIKTQPSIHSPIIGSTKANNKDKQTSRRPLKTQAPESLSKSVLQRRAPRSPCKILKSFQAACHCPPEFSMEDWVFSLSRKVYGLLKSAKILMSDQKHVFSAKIHVIFYKSGLAPICICSPAIIWKESQPNAWGG